MRRLWFGRPQKHTYSKMLNNTFLPRSHSVPKSLTAMLVQEVITIHRKFLSVPAGHPWQSAHTWEKQICLKMQHRQSNVKQMTSDFTCHSNVDGFFIISRQCVVARWNPTAKNIVSGPPKNRIISGPCHLWYMIPSFNKWHTLKHA